VGTSVLAVTALAQSLGDNTLDIVIGNLSPQLSVLRSDRNGRDQRHHDGVHRLITTGGISP